MGCKETDVCSKETERVCGKETERVCGKEPCLTKRARARALRLQAERGAAIAKALL